MVSNPKFVVFFDVGETLGVARISPSPNPRLERLDVYPYIPDILKQLTNNGIRLGVISNTGSETGAHVNEVLKSSGILDYFDPQLLIFSSVVGCEKNSPRIFKIAAGKAGCADNLEQCMYVGEDKEELSWAAAAGFATVPHPKLVWDVINGSRLRYARLKVPNGQMERDWRNAIKGLAMVPVFVTGEKGTEVYAVVSTAAAAALDDLGFEVVRLGSEGSPNSTDLYLLRDCRRDRTGFLAPEGQSVGFSDRPRVSPHVLCSSHDGLFVEVPTSVSIEDFQFVDPDQGFRKKLLPDPSLLQHFKTESFAKAARLQPAAAAPSLSVDELNIIKSIQPDQIRTHVERYSGVTTIDNSGTQRIMSRHVNHPDNAVAIETLVGDLTTTLGDNAHVTTHRFTHRGRTLDNVIAEIPGMEDQEIIMLGAHLDSMVSFVPTYNPRVDPAPGADDDASGVASLLVLAQTFQKLATSVGKPKHTIRLGFFNAEEVGLVGSAAYARDQAGQAAPIAAMYELDMIGYNKKSPKSCEIHAGIRSFPEIESRCVVLANELKEMMRSVSPDLEPQEYSSKTDPEGDPADRRSDHGSFQERGYTACLVIEDFCFGPGSMAGEPEANPNYHRPTDTFVDYDYAADITRAVAAAAWLKART